MPYFDPYQDYAPAANTSLPPPASLAPIQTTAPEAPVGQEIPVAQSPSVTVFGAGPSSSYPTPTPSPTATPSATPINSVSLTASGQNPIFDTPYNPAAYNYSPSPTGGTYVYDQNWNYLTEIPSSVPSTAPQAPAATPATPDEIAAQTSLANVPTVPQPNPFPNAPGAGPIYPNPPNPWTQPTNWGNLQNLLSPVGDLFGSIGKFFSGLGSTPGPTAEDLAGMGYTQDFPGGAQWPGGAPGSFGTGASTSSSVAANIPLPGSSSVMGQGSYGQLGSILAKMPIDWNAPGMSDWLQPIIQFNQALASGGGVPFPSNVMANWPTSTGGGSEQISGFGPGGRAMSAK